jgi:S1 RNA binding domain protein
MTEEVNEVKEVKEEIEIGGIVSGEVTNVTKFGAFVRLSSGEEGLVHISEIANQYVTEVTEFVNVGDKVNVKVLARNDKNKLELSIKKAEEKKVDPATFVKSKSKDPEFEDKMTSFLKKSEEKQIDIRRNLKHKQGISKKRK